MDELNGIIDTLIQKENKNELEIILENTFQTVDYEKIILNNNNQRIIGEYRKEFVDLLAEALEIERTRRKEELETKLKQIYIIEEIIVIKQEFKGMSLTPDDAYALSVKLDGKKSELTDLIQTNEKLSDDIDRYLQRYGTRK